MRTTIDLPVAVHARAREIAAERGESLSSVVADLVVRGLSEYGGAIRLGRSSRTGLPTIRLGATITSDDVAAAMDEE